jgi:hypothetical protein
LKLFLSGYSVGYTSEMWNFVVWWRHVVFCLDDTYEYDGLHQEPPNASEVLDYTNVCRPRTASCHVGHSGTHLITEVKQR